MSNPEETATQQEPQTSVDSTQPELTTEEKLEIAEKRRRDTQAGYTKGQQTIKAQEAEIVALKKQLEQAAKVVIPKEEQDRLDDLMYEDPVAWRQELNKVESKVLSESRARLEELTGEARKAAEREFELDRRRQVLEEFNASAPIAITDEIIANDVPPRITKKLAEGTIAFEDYLNEVSEYLGKGKVVKNEEVLNQPNLSTLAGGTKPSNYKADESLSASYAKTIF
jgi:hypothetical protein